MRRTTLTLLLVTLFLIGCKPSAPQTTVNLSSNAFLTNIALSAGTISPALDPETTSYTVDVDNSVSEITLTAESNDLSQTVTVDGTVVPLNSPIGPFALLTGSNDYVINVIAEDGVTKRTYTITVNRAYSDNTSLLNIEVSVGALDQTFDPAITDYSLSAELNDNEIVLAIRSDDPSLTIKVNDAKVAANAALSPILLNNGDNKISIEVIAENGIDITVYTLSVFRDYILNGQLDNPAIMGVNYTTATLSGVTDIFGNFEYRAGESVAFSIWDMPLGETISAKPKLSLFDLVPGAKPLEGLSLIKRHIHNNDPFVVVTNIASLLYTLDYDGNPINGIELPTSVSGLFNGLRIDFGNANWINKFSDHSFRNILNTANTQYLLANHRQVKKFDKSMASLYDAMQITNPSAPTIETYYAIKGQPKTKQYSYTYDIRGNRTVSRYDDDGDGRTDRTFYLTYDNNDNLTSQGNGPGDLKHDYDDDGNRIRSTRWSYVENYSYDQYGQMQSSAGSTTAAPSHVKGYRYDSNGNQTYYQDYYNSQSIPSSIWNKVYQYDNFGNLEYIITDSDNNQSTVNSTSFFYYDENDRLVTEIYDADSSSVTLNTRCYYGYDTQGNNIRTEFDSNDPNISNRFYNRTFNSSNLLIRSEYFSAGNNLSPTSVYTYEYDQMGNLISKEYDADNDPTTPNTLTTYAYDGSSQGAAGWEWGIYNIY